MADPKNEYASMESAARGIRAAMAHLAGPAKRGRRNDRADDDRGRAAQSGRLARGEAWGKE
ncbi:hypothetical protein SCATT_25190 [Streptantibioticus cattleyicolor NRRL 8057 = DSM 46488]|uniref:Uncharacterized protein n=1 Tax=Streptantibioticus cattleyicolor (strain ATCC 35852 / DSM 46488 / JCM 4925 / NBRC 14057 / NRRL 8057) TaxID=1003195 RepID=G8WU68_STREN|nr:hypothetical protein SCATT_25190 [Streptantibioticus cattleyicolor NRRL 8057 = DSM 46488]